MRRAALAIACALALPAWAVDGAVMERELCDPCVPPSVKKSARVKASPEGGALRAQVLEKLRAPFERAAVNGELTRERAAAAGLGAIARDFDAIDTARRGAIRFEDYKRFLQSRGAALD